MHYYIKDPSLTLRMTHHTLQYDISHLPKWQNSPFYGDLYIYGQSPCQVIRCHNVHKFKHLCIFDLPN